MKRLFLLILALFIALPLTACGESTPSASVSSNTASQEDFLRDMAKGINNRLSNTKSDSETDEMSTEKLASYWKGMVNYELNQIEKYLNSSFSDPTFDRLAHSYIYACEIQRTATDNWKNEDLLSSLWSSGRDARACIIIEMYEHYGLDITSDAANEYRSYLGNDSSSISLDTTYSDISDIMGSFFGDEISLNPGDLRIVGSSGEFNDFGSGDVFYNFSFSVRNDTSFALTVSLTLSVRDRDGNVVGSADANSVVSIPAGKTGAVKGSITLKSSSNLSDYPNACYIVPEELSYDSDGDSVFVNLPILDEDIKNNTLTISQTKN